MSATLATLRAQARNLLGDTILNVFTDVQIDDWINRAIEDLSVSFPLFQDYTVATTLGTHIYDLEPYIKGFLSVEYPTGQTPPRYLQRKFYTDPKFWLSEGYYDFIKPQTSATANPPQIYVSDHTPAAKTITIKCTTDHAPLLASGDECTVLDRHVHLIGLFVRWKALSERSSHEMMDPSPLGRISMEIVSERAETSYKAALAKAIAAEGESGQFNWKMDGFDRIY